MAMVTYVTEPKPRGASWDYPTLEHLDGVPWFEAPIPRRLHRCWAQTKGLVGFDEVERCACGAIRNRRYQGWLERNSSRKSPRRPVPDTPYVERKQAEFDLFEAAFHPSPPGTTDERRGSDG